MTKQQACTRNTRHKWSWVGDITLKTIKVNGNGTRVNIKRRGQYICECGLRRHGAARSGL